MCDRNLILHFDCELTRYTQTYHEGIIAAYAKYLEETVCNSTDTKSALIALTHVFYEIEKIFSYIDVKLERGFPSLQWKIRALASAALVSVERVLIHLWGIHEVQEEREDYIETWGNKEPEIERRVTPTKNETLMRFFRLERIDAMQRKLMQNQ